MKNVTVLTTVVTLKVHGMNHKKKEGKESKRATLCSVAVEWDKGNPRQSFDQGCCVGQAYFKMCFYLQRF